MRAGLAVVLLAGAVCASPASQGGSTSTSGSSGSVASTSGSSGTSGSGSTSGSTGTGCPWEATLQPPALAQAAGQVLDRRPVTIAGQAREAQLLRLPTADGRTTYAEWIPPLPDAGAAPAVLLTMPYDGIDWSGEPVDARWASACPNGTCLLPDQDGPGGGPDAGVIAYGLMDPATFAQERAAVFSLNGVGALGVFGRFYAGGSWWGYAQDMVAGLRFLGTRPEVDASHVGVLGGSLGGYEAFYAAAYAPPEVQPRALVPMFAPVDVAGELHWALDEAPIRATTAQRREAFAAFFDPYLRRVLSDTGGLPDAGGDFRCFAPEVVVPKVSGEVLIVQDDWDLLVSPALAHDLLGDLGSRAQQLWYLHPAPVDVDNRPLDHGPFDDVAGMASRDTFASAFLLLRLVERGSVIVPYQTDVMGALLGRWRDQSRAGLAQPGAAQRLAELADARVVLFEVTTGQTVAGPDAVSAALAGTWGTQVPATQVHDWLLQNGLPP